MAETWALLHTASETLVHSLHHPLLRLDAFHERQPFLGERLLEPAYHHRRHCSVEHCPRVSHAPFHAFVVHESALPFLTISPHPVDCLAPPLGDLVE